MNDEWEKDEWREYEKRIGEEALKWRAQWPNACPICHGWGGCTTSQGHPYGSTIAYEQIFDGCDYGKPEKCHRCGKDGLTENGDGPCGFCGWNYDDGEPYMG